METLFKVGVTLVVIFLVYFQIAFVVKVWKSQVDPKQSVRLIFKKFQPKPPELIVTRDPNKIYQDGEVVGTIDGTPIVAGKATTFPCLVETGKLKQDQPFEFERKRLKIVRVETAIGTLVTMSGSKNAVLKNVDCELIGQ